MSEEQVTLFNNYYFNLLKKLKNIARVDKNKDTHRKCIQAIKQYYSTYNSSSDEYFKYYNTTFDDQVSLFDSLDSAKNWLDLNKDLPVYQGDITLSLVREVLNSDNSLLYFIIGMNVGCVVSESEVLSTFVKVTQCIKSKDQFTKEIESIEGQPVVKEQLLLMQQLYLNTVSSGLDLEGIENTTIGKLAKEIMNEVDVSNLTESLNNNGDILKTLGDPNSGFTKLIGSVSQKLISKIATGEITNESLLKDAMDFSSKMKTSKMPPGMEGMGDMANMMSMFQGLMGSGGLGGASGSGSRSSGKVRVNQAALDRMKKAKQLKRKLDEKTKKAKENIFDV